MAIAIRSGMAGALGWCVDGGRGTLLTTDEVYDVKNVVTGSAEGAAAVQSTWASLSTVAPSNGVYCLAAFLRVEVPIHSAACGERVAAE